MNDLRLGTAAWHDQQIQFAGRLRAPNGAEAANDLESADTAAPFVGIRPLLRPGKSPMSKHAKLSLAKQKLLNNQHRLLTSAKLLFDAAAANLRLAENAMDTLLDNIMGEGAYNGYTFLDGKVVVEVANDSKANGADEPT